MGKSGPDKELDIEHHPRFYQNSEQYHTFKDFRIHAKTSFCLDSIKDNIAITVSISTDSSKAYSYIA
jgi:hypothetical protein